MIKLTYQGIEAYMTVEELKFLLAESNLPWYADKNMKEIFIIGYDEDITIKGETV